MLRLLTLMLVRRRTFRGSAGDAASVRLGRRVVGRPLREEAVKRATRTAEAVERNVPRRQGTEEAEIVRAQVEMTGCRRYQSPCAAAATPDSDRGCRPGKSW